MASISSVRLVLRIQCSVVLIVHQHRTKKTTGCAKNQRNELKCCITAPPFFCDEKCAPLHAVEPTEVFSKCCGGVVTEPSKWSYDMGEWNKKQGNKYAFC